MLITLEPNIKIEWQNLSNDFLDKLEWILLQHSNGNHYISTTRSAANFLEKNLHDLSRKSKEILSQLKSQSDDGLTIKKILTTSIEINNVTSPDMPKKITKDNKTIWQISLLDACKWLSEKTNLLSENLDDTELYEQAAKCYAITKDLPISNIALSHDITGGCGSAPNIVDRKIKEQARPVLLVLDSDRLSPKHKGHPSLHKCTIRQEIDGIVYYFKGLDARELENIIPISFIEESILELDESKDRDQLINHIDTLKKINKDHKIHYLFLDIKNGTCFNQVKSKGKAVSDFFSNFPIIENCPCSNGACAGKISPPLGENTIKRVREYFNNHPLKKCDARVKMDQPTAWIETGEIVYSMGFANKSRIL